MKQRRKVSKDSGADFGNPQLSDRSKNSSDTDEHESKPHHQQKKRRKKSKVTRWSCIDTCCWFIGCVCVLSFVLAVLYHAIPESVPQFMAEKISGPLPDPPGTMLRKEGLLAKHPVVFVPGIVTGGLEMWEGKPCAHGLFRKRLWGGNFGKIYTRPKCWMEHIMLDNETGLDPEGIRVRPVSGLVAADYFAPGYFVWAVLIENLASIGYEEKNMYMTSYDWRLTFQNTEVRDASLSRLKSAIESMVQTNHGNKVVVIPHSMGSLFFLHFLKWVETAPPMGGGGGPDWCARHIRAVMNIAGTFLGVPKAFPGLFSAEAKDIAVARAIAPEILSSDVFGLQTLQYIMRVTRSWDACMSMVPKGGNAIWGNASWSPEEGYDCSQKRSIPENITEDTIASATSVPQECADDDSAVVKGVHGKPVAHYGRMVAFGKEAASLDYSALLKKEPTPKAPPSNRTMNSSASCGDVWTEYQEMEWDNIEDIASREVYTAGDLVELLRRVAPKLMARGEENWGFGLADDLSDPKYQHFRHWSNPLETMLPSAPELEMYCLYGVGIPTERSYIYKISPPTDSCYIPFRIDGAANGDSEGCLKGGVQFVDGDETVPVLSSGFACAKLWHGKTRFNPAGSPSFVKEYNHSAPANFFEGRGTESGSHVDIMGNFALIEDILRVAAGQTGDQLGGNRIHSDLLKWSERIKIKL